MKRIRATLAFVRRKDGTIGLEIRTSPTLGAVEAHDGTIREPAEYVPRANVAFQPRGVPVRHLVMLVGVNSQTIVSRILDLSEGRAERTMLGEFFAQEWFALTWINEGLVSLHPIDERRRGYAREALEQTRGVSAEDWQEEVAEIEWQVGGLPARQAAPQTTVQTPVG